MVLTKFAAQNDKGLFIPQKHQLFTRSVVLSSQDPKYIVLNYLEIVQNVILEVYNEKKACHVLWRSSKKLNHIVFSLSVGL